MKYCLILMLFLFIGKNLANAQDLDFNPYNESLRNYLLSYLSENKDKNFDKIYILESNVTNESSLIKNVVYGNKNISIIVINRNEILKQHINSIIEIYPMKLSKNRLSIGIAHFGVEKKNRKLSLVNSMTGSTFLFEYNCSTFKYTLIETIP